MKMRKTFLSRQDLTVARESECLSYGPESARAYATVKRQHDAIMAERRQAKRELAPIRELLRKFSAYNLREVNTIIRVVYPESWARLHPWRQLARDGFDTVRWAAKLDTIAYDHGADFKPCDSPREAYERYSRAA